MYTTRTPSSNLVLWALSEHESSALICDQVHSRTQTEDVLCDLGLLTIDKPSTLRPVHCLKRQRGSQARVSSVNHRWPKLPKPPTVLPSTGDGVLKLQKTFFVDTRCNVNYSARENTGTHLIQVRATKVVVCSHRKHSEIASPGFPIRSRTRVTKSFSNCEPMLCELAMRRPRKNRKASGAG